MLEIESSLMCSAAVLEDFRPWADEFEQQTHIRVHLIPINWSRSTIFDYGIYGHGPDVSEVGTSWVSSLAAIHALRPFTPDEVRSVGGAEAFLSAAWKSCLTAEASHIWSLPWVCNSMVLYYRKDYLEQFGIAHTEEEFQKAFATHSALVDTLRRLQAAGIQYPLALWITQDWNVIHNIAPWVWGAGGEFLVPEGNRAAFNQPAALAGLCDYFNLRVFMNPACISENNSLNQLRRGEPAVAVEGESTYCYWRDHQPNEMAKWGITSTPGVPFVGGTNLVIWKHTHQEDAAVKWVKFMIHKIGQRLGTPRGDGFPASLKALDHLSLAGDRFIAGFVNSLQQGRGHVSARLWGLIEERLMGVLPGIWEEVLSDSSSDVEEVLHRNLDSLAQRLNKTLEG